MTGRIHYIFIYIAGSAFALLKMLAVASQLAPRHFGIYTLVAIAAGLLSYLNSLGIFDAFLIRLNQASASAAERRCDRDSGIIFSFVLSLFTTAVAIFLYTRVAASQPSLVTLGVTLALIVSQNLFNALMVEVQAGEQSITYASLLAVKSGVPLLIIVIVNPGDVLLFFLALDLLILVALIGYALYKTGWPRLVNFEVKRVVRLMREGVAFTAQTAAQNLSFNADKWAINFGLGAAQLGVYAFAAQLITFGSAFASMVQIYALPRIVRSHLGGGTSSAALSKVLKLTMVSLAVSLVFFAATILLGRLLIPVYYPQYLESISLLPLLALVAIIISCNHAEIFFRARGIGEKYLAIQVVTLVLLILAYVYLTNSGSSLNLYAIALAVARLVQMALAFGLSALIVRADARNGVAR